MNGPRVLLAASEAYPLAKTGGLGDFVAALAKALARAGCDVRLVLPGYPAALDLLDSPVRRFALGPLFGRNDVTLVQGRMPDCGLRVALVDCPALFRREAGPYQDADGEDLPDNAQRFALFARVAERIARGGGPWLWRPDIVHLNDWQTGPLAAMLAQEHSGHRPSTVFTIHNLAFPGLFGPEAMDILGLPRTLFEPDGLEFWGGTSFLKAGIRFADRVTTVSETYAREILTPAFGCGLEAALRRRRDGVVGIRNGIDVEEWGPAADPHLPATFDLHDHRGKGVCRTAVRARFGLDPDPDAPLLAYLCRLTEQKMADVVLKALPELAARGVQLAVMGRGDPAIEAGFRETADRHAGRIGVHTGYDEATAHRLLAGADILLAPARFEPCGLTQMYAMRYGAVPVASRVGGLAETVIDVPAGSSGVGDATGFLFDDVSVDGLTGALDRAIPVFRQPFLWRRLLTNGMRADFSWTDPAQRYVELYESLAPRSARVARERRSRLHTRGLLTAAGSSRARTSGSRAGRADEARGAPDSKCEMMATATAGRVEMAKAQLQSEKIRQRAYDVWERSNRPHGRDLEHWLQAERELSEERARGGPVQTAPKGARKAKARLANPGAKPARAADAAAGAMGAAAKRDAARGNKARMGNG